MPQNAMCYISTVNAELNSLSDGFKALTDGLVQELHGRQNEWVETELRKHAPVVCTMVDSGQPYAANRLLQALGFELAQYPNGDIELRQHNRVLSRLPSAFEPYREMALA